MKFYEFGDKSLPSIMLIHGAGWSYWLYLREARLLQDRYHVILPVIDGHGEEAAIPYTSTEKIAEKILEYIDNNCSGKLFAISGVSLGGQIAVEVLTRRKDIAQKAIIESAVCFPQPFMLKYSRFLYKVFGKLMFSEKVNKWSLKMLPKRLQLPEEITSLYLRDITQMSVRNIVQILDTYLLYNLKESLKESQADMLFWYGSKEPKCIMKSSELFRSYVGSCKVIELKGYIHAEISTYHPQEWVEKAEDFLRNK